MPRIKTIGCIAVVLMFSNVDVWASQAGKTEKLQPFLVAARDATARKNFSAAADYYRQAIGVSPGTPELWADLGLMYRQMGNSAEAIKSLREAVRLNPSLFVPQLFLGIEYLELHNTVQAIAFLQKAKRLNPTDPQVPLALGRAFAISGQSDRSSDAYWRVVTLAPNNGSAWLGLGTAYLQQIDSDARKMTSAYKDSLYVKLRAAESFAEEGRLIQAADVYRDALSATPPPLCAHASYGIVLLRQQKIPEASTELELERTSNSGCALTRLGLAALQLTQGDTESALKELVTIWKGDRGFLRESLPLLRSAISTEQGANLLHLANDREGVGEIPAEFKDVIRTGLQSDGLTSEVFPQSGDNNPDLKQTTLAPISGDPKKFYLSGQYRKCSESMRFRLGMLPASSLLLLAPCAFYAADYRTASLAARRLASNSATRLIGFYWKSKADQKLAIAALARAGEIDPNSSRMCVLLGDVYRQKRIWGDAEQEYQKALALEPGDRSARLGLAISLFEDAKIDEAFAAVTSLLQKSPDDPESNLLAGEILVQRSSYAEAETYLNKGRGTKPEFLPRLHALLGEVYAHTNRVSEAVSELKLGLVTDQDGSIHFQLARLYQKTGDKNGASEAFRISKQLHKQWDDRASINLQQSGTDVSRR